MPIELHPVDFDSPQVRDLLSYHVQDMREISPPGTSYALDLDSLRLPSITFLAAWDGEQLLGIGALKEIEPNHGEIKSMRTHPEHLRKGVAAILLERLIELARQRRYLRVSLETGTGPGFAAAEALYRRYGFRNGPVFGEYRESPHNQFMHLEL